MSQQPLPAYFSDSYADARRRFRAQAQAAGGRLSEHAIGQRGPEGDELTIDVAQFGAAQPKRVLVVSSGTHGIEGYFGSAVQLAAIDRVVGALPDGLGLLMIHAVNPYGFAWTRRVNEHNWDLNRNFMRAHESYEGADPGYRKLDAMLNPPTPPGGFEAFVLRAGLIIARHGFRTLKNAILQGQYEFPEGLFHGGDAPSRSSQILAEQLPQWLAGVERVVHLDFHTGMGKWGTHVLVVPTGEDAPETKLLRDRFGVAVQCQDPKGVLYEIRGGFAAWLAEKAAPTSYLCLLAEFGTYKPLQVLAALRAENRAHHYCEAHDPRSIAAKARLAEVFIPADPSWRQKVVDEALGLVEEGAATAMLD